MTFCHHPMPCHAGGVLELIDGFILHLATERGLSANYQVLVRRFLEAFASWFKEKHQSEVPAAVTTEHIAGFLAQRKKDGIAASSARIELIAVKIFFRWLTARKHIVSDPADPILPPRQEKHLPDSLNEQDAQKLIESVNGTSPLDRRDRAILELFYASGIRLSELADARLENLSLEEGWIRVMGKGSKTRLSPVGGAARASIAAWLEHGRPALVGPKTQSHVFITRNGTRGTVRTRSGAHSPALAAAQLCHTPLKQRRGSARDPGDAGPCGHLDDADLHARRSGAAEGRASTVSPEGVSSHVAHAGIDFPSGATVLDQIVGEADFAWLEDRDEAGAAEAEVAFLVALRDRSICGVSLHNRADAGGTDFEQEHVAEA
jgi:integrase/recombinase XerD